MGRLQVLASSSAMVVIASAAIAQTDTTFTYQGELRDGGNPADGAYNFDFSLWDAASDGSQIGSAILFNALPVNDGRFSVELDFGTAAFDNSSRWLAIAVNATELSPRQPITRAPYAIQTRGIFVDNSYRVGIGTTSPSAEATLHIRDNTGDNFGVLVDSFGVAGSSIGLHAGPASFSSLAKNAFFAPGWMRFDDTQGAFLQEIDPGGNVNLSVVPPGTGFVNWTSAMYLRADGAVGMGTTNPAGRLGVTTGGAAAIVGDTDSLADGAHGVEGVINSAAPGADSAGVYGLNESAGANGYGVMGRQLGSGFGVYGIAPDGRGVLGVGFAEGVRGEAIGSIGRGVWGHATSATGMNYGVYGQTSSPNGFDFYAHGGAGVDYGSGSSRRWKRNIEPIDDPLYKLSKIRGVYFDWDEEHGGHHDVGCIAEEVGAVLPEIVVYEENGIDAHGMDYGRMTALLVEAVKALQVDNDAEVASLRAENEELRARLRSLEQSVERLATLEHEETMK